VGIDEIFAVRKSSLYQVKHDFEITKIILIEIMLFFVGVIDLSKTGYL